MSDINERQEPKVDDVVEIKKRLDELEHPVRNRLARFGKWIVDRAATFRLPALTLKDTGIFATLLFLLLRVGLPTSAAVAPLAFHGCSIAPKPLPGDTPKVLVVFDELTQDLLSATDSDDVRSYLIANVAKGAEGTPEFRRLAAGADTTYEHPAWQEAMKKAKGKPLPLVLINGTISNYEGEVPKSNAEMVALLKKCFGDHRLPMLARPPPEAYSLGEEDMFPKDKGRGLVPQEQKQQLFGKLASFDLKEMSDEEIEAAIVRKNADRSWLDDLRMHAKNGQPFPSLDQGNKGFCWTHSTTVSVEYVRAANGQPFASLSAYSIACMINGFRDGGGWGVKSMEFAATKGIPSDTFWPQQSMATKNDNANTWADAAKHKVSNWIQLEKRNSRQLATCLCNNIPTVSDLDWWGHSIATVRLVSWGKNGSNLKTSIQNSWSDKWGTNGLGELVGSKAVPDDAVAPRVVVASYQLRDRTPEYRQAP